MAKCDMCNKRKASGLQKCATCQIAFCRDCIEGDRFKNDTRHIVDTSTFNWEKPAGPRTRRAARNKRRDAVSARARERSVPEIRENMAPERGAGVHETNTAGGPYPRVPFAHMSDPYLSVVDNHPRLPHPADNAHPSGQGQRYPAKNFIPDIITGPEPIKRLGEFLIFQVRINSISHLSTDQDATLAAEAREAWYAVIHNFHRSEYQSCFDTLSSACLYAGLHLMLPHSGAYRTWLAELRRQLDASPVPIDPRVAGG